ncbi:MAG: acetylornithine deacetylase [Salinarimonas sp.]
MQTGAGGSVSGRRTALEILADLVGFDTESHKSNRAIIDYIADYLAGYGVAAMRLPNQEGDKEALVATIGPPVDGGIVLSGHTDVVPVAGQSWTSDPFRLRVADGRAHGRGAVDMKGYLALMLALVPDWCAADLEKPVHLVFSYDEEISCLGVLDAIAQFGVSLPRPRAVIVGEPTGLEVADAHKSASIYTTVVHGFEAHSSKPALGANAVMSAAELVSEINRIGDDLLEAGDPSGRFDPPYSTVSVGTISGGTARNILAKECRFNWEIRGLPGLDIAAIEARFEAFCRSVETHRLNRFGPYGRIETLADLYVPGLAPEPGSEAERIAVRAAARNTTIAVPYGTEAGRFQQAGLSVVVCGPGSIDQAHQPDEYISLDQLAAGEAFMRRATGL